MMKGFINKQLEAQMEIAFRNADGTLSFVEALIDTGFSGELAAPEYLLEQLDGTQGRVAEFRTVDETLQELQSYRVKLNWLGEAREVCAFAAGSEVLISMQLLLGCKIIAEIVPGGGIEVSSLESPS